MTENKRVIKFRALTCGSNEWVYGHYTEGSHGHFIGKVETGELWQIMPKTVGQFTGLTDKNRKEIYEGDIIDFDRKEWGGDGNIHEVSWDELEGCWSWGGGLTSDMQYRTVIGNIYQNPDLLTSK